MSRPTAITFPARAWLAVATAVLLAGCSALPNLPNLPFLPGPEKPKPAELQPNPALLGVRQAWSTRIGEVSFPLQVAVQGNTVVLGANDGTVVALDAASGRELWRASAGDRLAAGVGSDGTTAAAITRGNEVVAFAAGRQLWKQKLPALSFTPPLVAGARVFVLAADRTVLAFDGASGRQLWSQGRQGDPLVLRQAGVLMAVGDTLVVGQGGRLAGLNPNNGQVRWETPVATPRGINDIERLVELVAAPSRLGNSVCVRAFQAAVGCVDTTRGSTTWAQRANGTEGLAGDAERVYGTENDGRVVAWRRADGQRAWTVDRLLHRDLTGPLALGRSVVVGDSQGNLHLLSRDDGSLLNRLTTDGSGIAAQPVVAGTTLVAVTRNGGVYGFVPN